MTLKLVRQALWLTVFFVLAYLGFDYWRAQDGPAQDALNQSLPIDNPYLTLTSHEGTSLDTRSFADGHQLIYFGFTFCPDVCPISTSKMLSAADIYGQSGAQTPLKTVFVSIDPKRDTPTELAQFRDVIGAGLVALTGSQAQIDEAKARFKVYAQRTSDSPEDYLFDHSDLIYWVNPAGQVRFFSSRQGPEDIARTLAVSAG